MQIEADGWNYFDDGAGVLGLCALEMRIDVSDAVGWAD